MPQSSSAPEEQPLVIGVLALQGAYDAHARMLSLLGATPRLVRSPRELDGLDGLIIPGGESTTILKFLERDGFFDALSDFVHRKPTFGTCAGTILLAKDVANSTQRSLERPRHHRGNATPTAARTTPPSLQQRQHFPAAPSKWCLSALRASPASGPA